MHHLIIDGDATCSRKGHFSRNTLEQRDRVVLGEEAVDGLIDRSRRHSRFDHRRGYLVCTPHHETSPPHQSYFTSGTKIDHASSTQYQDPKKTINTTAAASDQTNHEGCNPSAKQTVPEGSIPFDSRAASPPCRARGSVALDAQRALPALPNRFTASLTRSKISSAVPNPSTQASLPCRP